MSTCCARANVRTDWSFGRWLTRDHVKPWVLMVPTARPEEGKKFRDWRFGYRWVVGCLQQTVNPENIKNTKKIQNKYKPKLQKKYNHKRDKIIRTKEIQHTLVDLRCCFLTKCPKYKKTKSNLEKNEKKQKKYKNTKCIFGRNRKIQKKYKSTRCIFFVFFLYLFCIFLYFYKKNTKKIRIQNLKNTKYKKNTNPKSRKYKIQKKYEKNTNPKSQKYKIRKKRQIPCSLSEEKPKLQKKCKNNMLYFLHPAVLILYFQVVLFLYFFCIFNSFQHSLL